MNYIWQIVAAWTCIFIALFLLQFNYSYYKYLLTIPTDKLNKRQSWHLARASTIGLLLVLTILTSLSWSSISMIQLENQQSVELEIKKKST